MCSNGDFATDWSDIPGVDVCVDDRVTMRLEDNPEIPLSSESMGMSMMENALPVRNQDPRCTTFQCTAIWTEQR